MGIWSLAEGSQVVVVTVVSFVRACRLGRSVTVNSSEDSILQDIVAQGLRFEVRQLMGLVHWDFVVVVLQP